jgi:type IV pilus assembly protein PilC
VQTFTYTARDKKSGDKVVAEVQAENEKSAAKLLLDRGLTPLEITAKEEGSGFLHNISHRIKTKEKIIFSRQLSTLINAGLPLVQSLNTVMGQTPNKSLKAVIAGIISDVEGGSTLSDAMAKHPRVFNQVYVSLVAAGETSGTLDTSLERLSVQQEKDAEIVSKVRGALIYPVIVLVVLFGVVGFMLTTVLPQVESLYQGLPGAELPLITRVLLAVSNALINYWWVIAIVLGILAFFGTRWARTPAGQLVVDRLKLNTWPVKELFRKLYMARFARTASTLSGSGVPMIKMLNTTADAVGNKLVANAILKASEQVKGGKALSEGLRGSPYVLELVPNMIQIGEQSGQLEGMLGKVAEYYEKEVDNQIKSISTIIEPVMMIIVGVMALVIVAAILIPIYGLAGNNVIR